MQSLRAEYQARPADQCRSCASLVLSLLWEVEHLRKLFGRSTIDKK
jgi:hypothetical protein